MRLLEQLRSDAVSRTLFKPTSLASALERLRFVQADPIRAPARAQDLTLRHRVKGYRAGQLEADYAQLPIEEDVFVTYGFVSRSLWRHMHPRAAPTDFTAQTKRRAVALLDFVKTHGEVHPREADAHFSHGRVTNAWGGSSSATTHLLDALHYRGALRVAHRREGVRVYSVSPPHAAPEGEGLDALVDTVVALYAPLPERTLGELVGRLRFAAPQWRPGLRAALRRAKERLAQGSALGTRWFWPAQSPLRDEVSARVRLLAPFDPVVWDRRRFELLWGWAYRFEAYTPKAKRVRGYYALPLLWGAQVIGWGNAAVVDGRLSVELGYVKSRPREAAFRRGLEEELHGLAQFLGCQAP